MSSIKRIFCSILGVIVFTFLFAEKDCTGQSIAGFIDLNRDDYKTILTDLRAGKLKEVPRLYFGPLYNPNLANLVIFVDDCTNTVKIKIVQDGKNKYELFGARYIWAMVFWYVTDTTDFNRKMAERRIIETRQIVSIVSKDTEDTLLVIDKKRGRIKQDITFKCDLADSLVKEDTTAHYIFSTMTIQENKNSLQLTLESLDYRIGAGEKILRGVARAVSGVLGASIKAQDTINGSPDTSFNFDLVNIMPDTLKEKLFIGIRKVPLEENTINRIHVNPFYEKYTYTTFGNYSPSRLGIGLGFSVSFREVEDPSGNNVRLKATWSNTKLSNLEAEPYLFTHYYIIRRKLPEMKLPDNKYFKDRSCGSKFCDYLGPTSLVAGLKISEPLSFEDIFLGIGKSNLIKPFDFVFGINLTKIRTEIMKISETTSDTTLEIHKKFRREFMIGVSLKL